MLGTNYLVRALTRTATAPELAELYLLNDWDVHMAAFCAFQKRGKDALAQGLTLANSRQRKRRAAACWLMAVGGGDSTAPDEVLPRLLRDRHPEVVHAAVQAYNMLQVHRSSKESARRMQTDVSSATFPWPEPLSAFIDLDALASVADHADSGIRMMVAMALWMCGDAKATRLLVTLAKDEDEDVRDAALGSMGWKRYAGGVTDEVRALLWAGIGDSRAGIRATAARALVELGEPGAEVAFIEQLRAAIDRNASHGAIYPLVLLLYSDLSSFIPSDLREEACRRWAKDLVGKGPPVRSLRHKA
jgi:HEAT repeat protein